MEENLGYFLLQHIVSFTGMLIGSLEKRLSKEEKLLREKTNNEFKRQMELYEEGRALRPNKKEIYNYYKNNLYNNQKKDY